MVVARWDPNKGGNRERTDSTETEWLVLGGLTLNLAINLTNH